MAVTCDDLLDYAFDERLAPDAPVVIVIKGFNQRAIVERIAQRKGQRAYGLTGAADASDRRYSEGALVVTDLDRTTLDDDLLEGDGTIRCLEPFGATFHGSTLVHTAGDELHALDLSTGNRRVLTHDWLAYAHTVEVSPDGDRLLTSSAGFDTVLELAADDGLPTWEWNAWDHGFERSRVGSSHVTRNPQRAAALTRQGEEVLLVDDPAAWPKEGISTPTSPVRLNGASYDSGDRVLVTFYHRPELAVVARDGSFTLHNRGLAHPHSFRRVALHDHDGYGVASSGAGEYLLLDQQLRPERALSFASLPADEAKRRIFGEWIQSVEILDATRGLLLAVDALRDGVHIVDLQRRRRRFLRNPPEWTVQTVVPVPVTARLPT